MLTNYWVSWLHENGFGPLELHEPWWVSGEYDGGKTICAAIKAPDDVEARNVVRDAYDTTPARIMWRFVEERPDDWSPFSGRFPKADWMEW